MTKTLKIPTSKDLHQQKLKQRYKETRRSKSVNLGFILQYQIILYQ